MRKIWSSRKDRDKRKLMNTVAASSLDDAQVSDKVVTLTPPQGPPATAPDHLTRLVKPEWDLTPIKHQWINVASLAASLADLDASVRTFRGELRGCHLYLYKASTFKKFTIEELHSKDKFDDVLLMTAALMTALTLVNANCQKELIFGNPNHSSLTIDEEGVAPNQVEEVCPQISHWLTAPHPQLAVNLETGKFSPLLVEGLVHYLLFSDDADKKPLMLVVNILPMVPLFAAVMSIVCDYVSAVADKRMNGASVLRTQVVERVLQLLSHVEHNFGGFLLKQDTAPHVLRAVEVVLAPLFVNDDQDVAARVHQFKLTMLAKQQKLMELIRGLPAQPEGQSSLVVDNNLNPFIELNSLMFMKCNLFELAHAILTIDQRYFNQWNLNLDKLLLLLTVLDGDTFGGPGNANFYKKNPLLFNNDVHIHYLLRLLVNHLFVETLSTLDRKARLLEKWIDLGCLLDKLGNMLLWLGILLIILSQPVLRLVKVWLLVLQDYVKLLKNDWCPVLFELDRRHLATDRKVDDDVAALASGAEHLARDLYHIMAPRGLGKIYAKEKVIPYFGDLVINNTGTLDAHVNVDELLAVWKRINYLFSRWNEYLANLANYLEIIKYNEDVLQRYDSMGFIFSNELLNQVLYMGTDGAGLDTQAAAIGSSSSGDGESAIGSDSTLPQRLSRLIEINCELVNLDKIMKLLLALEPELPEAYLKPTFRRLMFTNHPLSLQVLLQLQDSLVLMGLMVNGTSEVDIPTNRLPLFNNDWLKINWGKYDGDTAPSGDLSFRPDTGAPATGPLSTVHHPPEGRDDDDDDVPGLGIDVDDILNLDQWRGGVSKPEGNSNTNEDAGDAGLNAATTAAAGAIPTYLPRAGTIDKLIDLLLIDARHFELGILVDLTEYRFVFLLNYNLFLLTKELLDKLAYRFINLGNAVISIMKQLLSLYLVPAYEFPNWQLDTAVDLKELGLVDYELLLKIQINILKVLIVLVNNFYSYFSIDLINKLILIKLLKLFSNEILQWYNLNKIVLQNLEKLFENLVNYYKKLKKLFVKKLYRPVEVLRFDEYLINEFKFNNSLPEVPINRNLPGHKNVAKIEKFLTKFNKLLAVFYRGITVEDWMKIYKVTEQLFTENRLLDFALQKLLTPDEYIVVLNIFTYFELLVDQDKHLVLKQFPLVFRKLFKLFFKFRLYLLVQLTDAAISADERLDRMKTLLIMVKVAQQKMSRFLSEFDGHKQLAIPLCIELAVTTVIYSPELRIFSYQWLRAASEFHDDPPTQFDDLELLLPSQVQAEDPDDQLLPCFGWIIENVLDINKIPLFVGGPSSKVINFNKRYLVYRFLKLVENASGGNPVATAVAPGDEPSVDDTREFDFLLKLDEALVVQNNLTIGDYRDPHSKDNRRLFRGVLREQHKILMIEYKKKQIREQSVSGFNPNTGIGNPNATVGAGFVTLVSLANLILTKKALQLSLRRQLMLYKLNLSSRFKISGLFSKSRPFLLNGNQGGLQSHGHHHHNSVSLGSSMTLPLSPMVTLVPPLLERVVLERELPPQPESDMKQKPIHVITLKNRKIFPVYLMPLCFKIDQEGGEDFFFQARLEADLNDWLVKLGYLNRHWFFSRVLNNNKVLINTTFGIPLMVVASRDQALVPKLLVTMFEFIEREGLEDVGIYRILCLLLELASLKQQIDTKGLADFGPDATVDVHAATLAVKLLLRELPDALLTDPVIEQMLEVKPGIDEKCPSCIPNYQGPGIILRLELARYTDILKRLPTTNYHTLRLLLQHLARVALQSSINKMTPSNLATVIGPALTESLSLDSLVTKFGVMNQVLEKLIVNLDQLFDGDFSHTTSQQVVVPAEPTVTLERSYPATIIGTPVLSHHPRVTPLLEKIDDAEEDKDDTEENDTIVNDTTDADEAVPHHSHGRNLDLKSDLGANDDMELVAGESAKPSFDALGLPTPTIDDEDN